MTSKTAPNSLSPLPQRSAPCVVVADGDVLARGRLGSAIERLGYEVVACASGDEAVETLRRGDACAAVLDIRRPGLGGIDTLARLLDILPSVRAIVFTCFGSRESVAASFDFEFLRRALVEAFGPGTTGTPSGGRP